MNDRKAPETEQELLERVGELFDEIDPETPEELDAALQEAGFDPDAIGARMEALAREALQQSPLNWRNQAHKEMEAERQRLAAAQRVSPGPANREAIKSSIQALVGRLGPAAGQLGTAHHRNLEDASDDDLLSLLADLEYLAGHEDGSDTKPEG